MSEITTVGNEILIPCLPAIQPLGELYIAAVPGPLLLQLAFNDVRGLRNDVDDYMGIQRSLKAERVNSIQSYVQRVDASFPTAVILNITSDKAFWDDTNKVLHVVNEPSVAQVLDGQHRLAGLEGFDRDFVLNVVFFVGMDLEDQAMLFATINLEQKAVNKSLMYDLFAFAKTRSPQRTAHLTVVSLDRAEGSALHGRVKRLGSSDGERKRTVSQASLVESILPFISDDPARDRDDLRRGKRVAKAADGAKQLPLRSAFVEKKDVEIRELFGRFFAAEAQRWPRAWRTEERGQILCRTTGIKASCNFLKSAMSQDKATIDTTEAEFLRLLNSVPLNDDDFSSQKFSPGGSGLKQLTDTLISALD